MKSFSLADSNDVSEEPNQRQNQPKFRASTHNRKSVLFEKLRYPFSETSHYHYVRGRRRNNFIVPVHAMMAYIQTGGIAPLILNLGGACR
jgi:hypothetical protein